MRVARREVARISARCVHEVQVDRSIVSAAAKSPRLDSVFTSRDPSGRTRLRMAFQPVTDFEGTQHAAAISRDGNTLEFSPDGALLYFWSRTPNEANGGEIFARFFLTVGRFFISQPTR